MRTKVSMGLAALGLGAAMLTGCGGDDDGDGGNGGGGDDFVGQSADEIVTQAKDEMAKLTSVRIVGDLTSDGQDIELDLQLSTDADCTGSIGFGGGTTELLGTGGSVWMKPDDAFWQSFAGDAADQVQAAVGDKWVVIPSDDSGFGELCDLDELLDEIVDDGDDTTYTKGGEEELDGEQVIAVESDGEDGPSTGYVLVDSPHYLVKIEQTEGDEPGSVSMSQFDEPVEVEAPSDDEVVDLDSLG